MITTSDTFVIENGSKQRFAAASVYIVPIVHNDSGTVHIEMRVISDSALVDSGIFKVVTIEFTYAELLAFTASGADDIEEFYNLCEQAAVDYLENVGGNGGVTFSIT